ncbi:M24 family metallopeptidase [Agromyces sp. G08B096]|uniref:M24 family metallopeptidase n=1 Tax=Agromyces sp. G08B096 TaxID=3156399 RepID=A0AAU7W532_9MICO
MTAAPAAWASPSADDRAAKRRRILALLDERGVESIVLRSHAAIAWYLDGVRSHVSLAGDPVLAVVVDRSGDEIRVLANEADRLAAEELAPGDLRALHPIAWHEALAPAGIADLEEADAAAELRAARAVLLPAERERFRRLGREAAEVMTAVAGELDPSWSERRAAARIAGALVERGIDPLVVLVAGEGRLAHRHPLPTDGVLGGRAMLVACARRHGLIANLTRWVAFTAAAEGPTRAARLAWRDDEARMLEVERAFLDATRPGATLGEAFAAGAAAYARHGFDAEEWRRHHQGGAAGYVGRDPRAVPGIGELVQVGQAFAWNPSAPGAKVEDTVVRDATGFEVLTIDPAWPSIDVGGRARPVSLLR